MRIKTIAFMVATLFALIGTTMAQHEVKFAKPAEEGAFTIFAYSPEKTVIIDTSGKTYYAFDTAKSEKVGSFTATVEQPKAATWAGTDFWLLDQKTEKIVQVDPENGNVLRDIPAPKPEGAGQWSYEGLTWDGKYLWVAYFAGFSSKIVQVNPENGEVLQDIYADANLKGIYSDGTHLWGLCYNGTNHPAVVDKRMITPSKFETAKSREFLGKVEITEPRGLAFDGNQFLTLDAQKGEIVRFSPKK
jgi:hypothetical protein